MWYEYKPHQNIFCIGFVKSQHICNHTPIYHKCKSNTSANTNWQPANTKVPMQNTKIATCKYKNTNAKYKPHQSVLCSGLVKSQHIGNRTPRPLRAPPPSPMKIILISTWLLRFLVQQNTALFSTFRLFVRPSQAWHINFFDILAVYTMKTIYFLKAYHLGW